MKNKHSTFFVKAKNLALLIFTITYMLSCEEIIGIDPGITQEEILVIEGGITNQPPPYYITLRTAKNVTGVGENTLGVGATLTLSDQSGNSEQLIEIRSGNYRTSSSGIIGQVGESYKLNIQLSNGEEYESEFDLMPSPVVVNNLYEELVYEPVLSDQLVELGEDIYHKIYADIFNDQDQELFIKSNQVRAIEEREIGLGTGCEIFGLPLCYTYREPNVSELYLTSNKQIGSENINFEIARVPIVYKGLYYTQFSIESISPKAYDYYAAIKQQLETAGTIFDPLIPAVPGNVYGINGTERNVEGYFRAYSITDAEICYSRKDVQIKISIPPACNFCWVVLAPAVENKPPEMQNCQ